MNELIRMQYIDAMGIDMFVPRRQLLNAKASGLCDLPVRVKSGESVGAPSALADHLISDARGELEHRPLSKSSGAAVQSILEDFTKPSKDNRSVSSTSSPISSSEALTHNQSEAIASKSEKSAVVENVFSLISRKVSREKVDFSLGLWRVGHDLQVIDSRSRGDALPTETLLRNILRSHECISSPQQVPPQEIINWPLGDHAAVVDSFDVDDDQSWSAAHEMLMSFLEGRLLSKPVKMFWLMGEDALKAVMGKEISFDDCVFNSISIDSFAAEALVLPSLRDCLTVPESKKRLWVAINRFIHECTSSSAEKE